MGGFEGGENASVGAYPGAAVGSNATATTGGAVGAGASSGFGGAVGWGALAYTGGAMGDQSRANQGGAIGSGAQTGDGFAGGYYAKTVDADGKGIDAIQLGEGTNSDEKTLQIYDYTLMNSDGTVPAERLVHAPKTDVSGKADKPIITENTDGNIVLTHNMEYRVAESVTSISLTTPDTVSNDFICSIVFKSGAAAMAIDYSDVSPIWRGDDVADGVFIPLANKVYNIIFYWDGFNMVAVVGGYDV